MALSLASSALAFNAPAFNVAASRATMITMEAPPTFQGARSPTRPPSSCPNARAQKHARDHTHV